MKVFVRASLVLMGLIGLTATACRKREYITINNLTGRDTTVVHDTIYVRDTVYVDTSGGSSGGGGTGQRPCAPDTAYFVNNVLPILQARCVSCHSSSYAADGVNLSSYAFIMADDDLVTPFSTRNSELYEVITTTDHDDRMPPPPSSALTSSEIATIQRWILQGALNNSCTP